MRPILSALTTGTYKWVKVFVSLLPDLTSNEYTLKDSFEFGKVIREQISDLSMASLDEIPCSPMPPLMRLLGFFPKDYLKVIVLFMVLTKKEELKCRLYH